MLRTTSVSMEQLRLGRAAQPPARSKRAARKRPPARPASPYLDTLDAVVIEHERRERWSQQIRALTLKTALLASPARGERSTARRLGHSRTAPALPASPATGGQQRALWETQLRLHEPPRSPSSPAARPTEARLARSPTASSLARRTAERGTRRVEPLSLQKVDAAEMLMESVAAVREKAPTSNARAVRPRTARPHTDRCPAPLPPHPAPPLPGRSPSVTVLAPRACVPPLTSF